MRYMEDKKRTYEQDIIKHLRAHNNLFVGDREVDKQVVYALEEGQVVGVVHTNLFWDWVSMGKVVYKDKRTLSTMLGAVDAYYGDRAVGIKKFSDQEQFLADLREAGLRVGGKTAGTPKTPVYTMVKAGRQAYEVDSRLTIRTAEDPIDSYEEAAEAIDMSDKFKSTADQAKSQPEEEDTYKEVFFVALDGDQFAGGIYAEIEDDSMYISRLAVDPAYRGHDIGSKLMQMAVDRARDLALYNITTGTCSFQAKDFYIKLGYRIVFTKDNDPKGYASYSLEKKLQG